MLENFEEGNTKTAAYKGKYVSVMIQYGYERSSINGKFLGDTDEHFIVKNNKNKVVYINKNKIVYYVFKED